MPSNLCTVHQEQIGPRHIMLHGPILRQLTLALLMQPTLTKVQLQEIGTGALAPLRGPDEVTRQARDFEDQKQRAKEYASTIQELAKSLESSAKSFTVEPNSTHRPDKWKSSAKCLRVSIHDVRARAEKIRQYPSSSDEDDSSQLEISANRSKRRRPKCSKRFNESLQKALKEQFQILS